MTNARALTVGDLAILEQIVMDAMLRHRATDPVFHWINFAHAIKSHMNMGACESPGGDYCRELLAKIPFLKPIGEGFWSIKGSEEWGDPST